MFGTTSVHRRWSTVAATSSRDWTGRSGRVRFRWSGAGDAHRAGTGPLVGELVLGAGEERHLVLEVGVGDLPAHPPDAARLWNDTERAWALSVAPLDRDVVARHDAEQALAVMDGMKSAGGGMVAAATTSLPERAREGRNYDYRYVWIRDQAYAGLAAAAHDRFEFVDAAVRFLSDRLLAEGPMLRPAYTVDGDSIPRPRRIDGLDGYPGGSDRTGNWVNGQFQLDVFGEALELYAAAGRAGRLEGEQWKAVEVAADAIESRWTEPDAGIWELEPRRWAHSRLACAAGLRAVVPLAPPDRAARWEHLADVLLADVRRDCIHPSGRWQRSPEDRRVDASLLIPYAGALFDASSQEAAATVDSVESELASQGYVYRFHHDDRALEDAEGAFLLCGFFLSMVKARQGHQVQAMRLFERNRAAAGSPGLFAEEFDVDQHQLRGNVPQAFVHALLLRASAIIAGQEGALTGRGI